MFHEQQHALPGVTTPEEDVVRIILSSPHDGMIAARAAGLDGSDIPRHDLRLILAAAEFAGRMGRARVVVLAKKALQANGYWSARSQPWDGRDHHWSDEKLAAFACSWADFWSALSASELARAIAKLKAQQPAEVVR